MPTLSEYFDAEARNYLDTLRQLVGSGVPDAEELQRAARGLRGSAQMAREDRVYRAGLALESAARMVAGATLSWTEEMLGSARGAVEDLRALVERSEAESALDVRLQGSLQRWQNCGVTLPGAALGRSEAAPAAGSQSQEFRAFAAREVSAIADALDQGVRDLAADPMDREALKAILRRQRALLGAARLDEIPVVAEILRAVEDLTRVIAKLDVGVKQEWLDIYRVAREGLKATVEALENDREPQPSNALSRLRHMRQELMDRYGAGEAVSAAAGQNEGLAQARQVEPHEAEQVATTPVSAQPAPPPRAPAPPAVPPLAPRAPVAPPAPAAPAGPLVAITELEYRGEAALRRALELRQPLEDATSANPDARDHVDELFDLIRLALG